MDDGPDHAPDRAVPAAADPPAGLPVPAGLPGEALVSRARLSPVPPPRAGRVLLGLSLIVIALNLRPVFSSVSALLPEIMAATGLQPGAASLMTTLPVLCLGLFAPLAPLLAGRFGAERTIVALLALLAAGTALRGWGTVPALLAGATAAGASIAVINVLLPSLVKRDFPDRLALMTGLFTMALSAGAAAAAGLTVPLRGLLGGSWALALAAWAVPAVLALGLWAVLMGRSHGGRAAIGGNIRAVWRHPLAWQITLFMGLQSGMAYCVFGYLAPLLRERGLPAATAGLVVAWSVVMQCVACLVAPAIAVRRPDQQVVNVAFFVLAVGGFVACALGPLGLVVPAATVQGFGQGGLIALAMTAIVLRAADANIAAGLSSMVQAGGYTLAALGPLLLGLIRERTGSYAGSALLFVVLGTIGAACAYGAGRDRRIGGVPRPR